MRPAQWSRYRMNLLRRPIARTITPTLVVPTVLYYRLALSLPRLKIPGLLPLSFYLRWAKSPGLKRTKVTNLPRNVVNRPGEGMIRVVPVTTLVRSLFVLIPTAPRNGSRPLRVRFRRESTVLSRRTKARSTPTNDHPETPKPPALITRLLWRKIIRQLVPLAYPFPLGAKARSVPLHGRRGPIARWFTFVLVRPTLIATLFDIDSLKPRTLSLILPWFLWQMGCW